MSKQIKKDNEKLEHNFKLEIKIDEQNSQIENMKEKFKEFEKNKKDDFKVGKTITDNNFIIKRKDDAQNKVDGKEVNKNKSQIKSSKPKLNKLRFELGSTQAEAVRLQFY